jgi:hypothetical protein
VYDELFERQKSLAWKQLGKQRLKGKQQAVDVYGLGELPKSLI